MTSPSTPPSPARLQWVVAPTAPAEFLRALPGIHALVAQVLWARGIQDPADISAFCADDPDACDPYALQDMAVAVERIVRALDEGALITIYGDYDCDGVTACALLHETLTALGARVPVYIPDRFDEGYGVNAAALDKLKAEGAGLVITVDCGARAVTEALHARAIGLDLIVSDHHELEGGALPQALAVINPHRSDCHYPFKQLSGVGLAYRLAQALLQRARQRAPDFDEHTLLDLVAIGTVADVAPLLGENRRLVRDGLQRIRQQPRMGVRFLAAAAGVNVNAVTAQTIGFALAPRLNAAGRIDSALDAFTLLTTHDESVASQKAQRLNERNEQRQKLTAAVTRHAEQRLPPDMDALNTPLVFAMSDDYNLGVIGLAATRLAERYNRPAIVVSVNDAEARGSCRSVEGFHITAALDQCKHLLSRYGGHAAAAGFTAPTQALGELQQQLAAIAGAAQPVGGWQRILHADAEINLYRLTHQSYVQLALLEPHGMANPRPVFVCRQALVQSTRRVGKNHNAPSEPGPHLQLRLHDSRGGLWEAIAWQMGPRAGEMSAGAKIDLAFRLDVNEWNGERKLQLVVQDFRAASELVVSH
jgi:single-stranded-DNA-specific exonuclease